MTTGCGVRASSAASSSTVTRVRMSVAVMRCLGVPNSASRASAHRLLVPLVELLHAVFHRALVRAGVVVAALDERPPAGVHAQRDLVVLGARLPIRRLLGLDELALEGVDVLG